MNSNTSTQTATPASVPATKTQQQDMPIAWREFAAGMEFLRRYGAHNTANTNAISRDNLRLLHRSLLQDNTYRRQVHSAQKRMPQYGHPTRTTLLATSRLSAQLIHIPANSNIRLSVRPTELAMLMILSGSLSTDSQLAAQTQASWWSRGWYLNRRPKPGICQLKSDDIICIKQPRPDNDPRLLATGKKSCVVLAVFSHQQYTPPQTSPHNDRPDFHTALLQSAL